MESPPTPPPPFTSSSCWLQFEPVIEKCGMDVEPPPPPALREAVGDVDGGTTVVKSVMEGRGIRVITSKR